MNRFADDGEKLVILTAEESKREDYWALVDEKHRLLDLGFKTTDVRNFSEFHRLHPDVALRVDV